MTPTTTYAPQTSVPQATTAQALRAQGSCGWTDGLRRWWPLLRVRDPEAEADVLRQRRHGLIEIAEGRLVAIHLRPWSMRVSLGHSWLLGKWCHWLRQGDRCWLYYDQIGPLPCFMALRYLVSARGTRLASVYKALEVLETIGRLKDAHALLCDVSNRRISDRVLKRRGWQPHAAMPWHRNYIHRLGR